MLGKSLLLKYTFAMMIAMKPSTKRVCSWQASWENERRLKLQDIWNFFNSSLCITLWWFPVKANFIVIIFLACHFVLCFVLSFSNQGLWKGRTLVELHMRAYRKFSTNQIHLNSTKAFYKIWSSFPLSFRDIFLCFI